MSESALSPNRRNRCFFNMKRRCFCVECLYIGSAEVSHSVANVRNVTPERVAYAHIHVGFEVMLYILDGRVRHEYGDGLTQVVENGAGDFIFIEPGVPHEVFMPANVPGRGGWP